MNLINSLKKMYYAVWVRLVLNGKMDTDMYSPSAQRTRTHTLQFRSIKTIGSSTATQGAEDSTSRKLSQSLENIKANLRADSARLELQLKGQRQKR